MAEPTRADDLRDLDILDLLDHREVSDVDLAARIGRSRSAVQGLRARISKAALAHRCLCTKPENRDAGMPRRWWDRPRAPGGGDA